MLHQRLAWKSVALKLRSTRASAVLHGFPSGQTPRYRTPVARRGRKARTPGVSRVAERSSSSMFWNGGRWLPDDGQGIAKASPPPRRRARRFGRRRGSMILALVGLIIPFAGAGASSRQSATHLGPRPARRTRGSCRSPIGQIRYRGGWTTSSSPSYLGGQARVSGTRVDARATLRLTGRSISWIGSVGSIAARHWCSSTAGTSRR